MKRVGRNSEQKRNAAVKRSLNVARNPEELLPLTPALFHILLSLADRELHGYDIMREVDERTGGKMRLGPGTLYGSIKRMLRWWPDRGAGRTARSGDR